MEFKKTEECPLRGKDTISPDGLTDETKSEHRIHKWLVFASMCLVMSFPVGLVFSLGALFVPFMNTFQASRTEASLIQSVALSGSLCSGFIHGLLMLRFGMVKTGLAGATLASLGYGLSFFASSVHFLIGTIGVAAALGTICLYIVSSAAVGHYFEGKQSFILLSIANGCQGVGGMVFPYLLAFLNRNFSLWGTLLICAGLVMNTIPCAFLWTHPHRQKHKNGTELSNKSKDCFNVSHEQDVSTNNSRDSESELQTSTFINTVEDAHPTLQDPSLIEETTDKKEVFSDDKNMSLTNSIKQLFKNRSYIFLIIGLAFAYPPVLVLISFIADVFQDSGLSLDDANLGLLLLNACSIIGRLLPGIMMQSKYIKAMFVPILASFVAAGAMLGLILTKSLQMKLLFSSMGGISFGSLVSCFSVTVLDVVDPIHLGNAIGLAFTSSGLANIAAGPVSGFIRDKTGSYFVVFILASAVQFVAVCMFLLSQRWQNKKASLGSRPTLTVTKL